MDSFKVEFYPQHKHQKYQPYFFSVLGILYIILGFINISRYDEYSFHDWIWIIFGIVFLFLSFYQKRYTSKYIIELTDIFFYIKQSVFKKLKINWTEIKEIHIKPISIEFLLKAGKTENISLGNVGYQNVLDIKEKLFEFAKHNNIPIK